MSASAKATPMMAQWHACKKAAPGAILLFRLGDFYEAFYDDAVALSKALNVTLTKRHEVPMSGIPVHTCDNYIDKLVSKGLKVAVAEQTEDARYAKGLVKREVVRIVTPGTVITSSLLNDHTNNFFASLTQAGSLFGLAFLDLTTAEFRVFETDSLRDLVAELHRVRPAELLTTEKFKLKNPALFAEIADLPACLLSFTEEWHFDPQITTSFLINHFHVHSLDGFGLKGMITGINAAGALLAYLQDHLSHNIDHILEIHPYTTSQFMTLDRITQRNLELTESLLDGSRKNTLLAILDHTETPMGARLLRQWIKQPLLAPTSILERQNAIATLLEDRHAHETLLSLLAYVRDLERLMMKVSAGYATPRDLQTLRASYEPVPEIKSLLSIKGALALQTTELQPLPEMTTLIATALVDEPPLRLSDGKIFRDGYNKELDELRALKQDSKTWMTAYQEELKQTSGIRTLKVGYTKVFGFYIEISKGQADRAPTHFHRRQTLTNAERFITPELKEYEEKLLHAEERILSLETTLFQQLKEKVMTYANQVLPTARALGVIDALQSLAKAAYLHDYTRPTITEEDQLHIESGRHPIIEGANLGRKFVPNDTHMDNAEERLMLITGPNMAGKSTYIRQVALITIMAQIGSFVPAKKATIGVIDKVFTRIGASDDLSRGQSTFMVEMAETANILNNATARSLIILDEIGRGTSTYDGISIAWAVAEHLLSQKTKTLFATHYWELTKLEKEIPGAVNYNVAVHESADDIIFLHKIVRGDTDRSYGIHVARLAGLPIEVVARASELLIELEESGSRKLGFTPKKRPPKKPKHNEIQLTIFE